MKVDAQKPEIEKKDVVCNTCGKYDAFEVGDRHLCVDCYGTSGSCCSDIDTREESGK